MLKAKLRGNTKQGQHEEKKKTFLSLLPNVSPHHRPAAREILCNRGVMGDNNKFFIKLSRVYKRNMSKKNLQIMMTSIYEQNILKITFPVPLHLTVYLPMYPPLTYRLVVYLNRQ